MQVGIKYKVANIKKVNPSICVKQNLIITTSLPTKDFMTFYINYVKQNLLIPMSLRKCNKQKH